MIKMICQIEDLLVEILDDNNVSEQQIDEALQRLDEITVPLKEMLEEIQY